MPKARGTAIHGTRRVVLRQRRFRGIFLHPRTRGAVPAPLRHEGKGPRGHHRLVLRLLQHPTSAQLGRVATTRRLREDRDHPTGGRIKEASTFSGEAHFAGYTHQLVPFASGWLLTVIVWAATAAEATLGVLLLTGDGEWI